MSKFYIATIRDGKQIACSMHRKGSTAGNAFLKERQRIAATMDEQASVFIQIIYEEPAPSNARFLLYQYDHRKKETFHSPTMGRIIERLEENA